MAVTLTILGCGGSGGLPLIGNKWGKCNPDNPKNRRTRTSVHVDMNGTRFLVDTGPDLRQQCLREGVGTVDALIWTHDHADHSHGIDDVRVFARNSGHPVDCYMDDVTYTSLAARFTYAFQETKTSTFYRPFITSHVIDADSQIHINGQQVQCFKQPHGHGHTLGLRFGPIAYSTDVSELTDDALAHLEGVHTWVVDCLTWHKHPTHGSWDVVKTWIDEVKPQRVVLTHLGADMDYDAVQTATPDHVEPAYDGMKIVV